MPCCGCIDDLEGIARTHHEFITFFQCQIPLFTCRLCQKETGDAVKKPLHLRAVPAEVCALVADPKTDHAR